MPRTNFSMDLVGQVYGRLTVCSEAEKLKYHRRWNCVCECGAKIVAYQTNLRNGHTQSCGCMPRHTWLKHGKSYSAEYRAWVNMIGRCENPNIPGYENYGGRGIKIDPLWRSSFEEFYADMGDRPTSKHSVDRIDVNDDYKPGNCRWATQKQQMRNVRHNRMVSFQGREVPLIEATEALGLKYNTVLYRLLRGKTVEEALR